MLFNSDSLETKTNTKEENIKHSQLEIVTKAVVAEKNCNEKCTDQQRKCWTIIWQCNFCKSAKILLEERAEAYADIDMSITCHEWQ